MPESSSRVNQYMLRYIYRFAQPTLRKIADVLNYESNEDICAKIRQHNVLVIDDENTSGHTLNEILRVLRILNEDCEIAIFSLIGCKDLMADVN